MGEGSTIWTEECDIQLNFDVENFFLLGSPLSLFVSIYNRENYVRSKLPRCENFYNLYHPSDLIAYRLEPIIKTHLYSSISENDSNEEELLP